VLYNQAVLTSGARIEDPNAYVTQLNELLVTLAGDTAGDTADEA
jgi:HSP90 family molecular chaperone